MTTVRFGQWAALACAAILAGAPALRAADALGGDEYFVRTAAKAGDVHQPSARSAGMGGARTALSNGAASINENPAALGASTNRSVEALLGYASVDDGDKDTSELVYRVGAAMSLSPYMQAGRNQTVGAAYTGRDLDNSLLTGKFDQDAISLAYGANYGSDLLWGVALTGFTGDHNFYYNSTDREKQNFSGGELAAGVLYRLGDDFTVGGTASYAGGNVRAKRYPSAGEPTRESGDLDRWELRVGAAWQLLPTTLLAADLGYGQSQTKLDTRRQKIKEWEAAVGVEHALIPEALVARAGVNYHKTDYDASGSSVTAAPTDLRASSYSDDYVSFTAGLGARFQKVDLNYTLDLATTGDIGNYFSAQFGF